MQMQKLGINSEHFSSVQQINQYLEQHRINQLFNVSLRTDSFISRPPCKFKLSSTCSVCFRSQELMTNILNEKPADPKQAILKMLQSIQKKQFNKTDPHNNSLYQFQQTFLTTEDFEAIFDSYDVLQIQQIPVNYLEHALKLVGVDLAREIIEERYENMLEDDTINKVSFVFILEQEHRRNGFLNQGI